MGCKNEEERIACLLHAATGDLCCRCIIRLFHCGRAEALFRLRWDAHKTGIEITDRGICVAYKTRERDSNQRAVYVSALS
jgi:hypothetical protein